MSHWLDFAMPDQATKTFENLRENLLEVTDDDVKLQATPWRPWIRVTTPAVPA